MNLGLHIKLNTTFEDILKEALETNQKTFQTFFSHQKKGFYTLSDSEKKIFLEHRGSFNQLFVHGSYKLNLANNKLNIVKLFEQETHQLLALEFDYLVLHPGARSESQKRDESIDHCAQQLNYLLKKNPSLKVILENVAHEKKAIGGDFSDLKKILEKSDRPDQIFFCLDTAHAFAWGYPSGENLIRIFEKNIPIEKLALIHLNDSKEKLGSKVDRHAIPGQGLIPKKDLQVFLNDPRFQTIPKILELPDEISMHKKNILQTLYERLQ